MKTIIVPINKFDALTSAKTFISQDQVIAAPTDTVYGVMCRYDSATAISQLYEVKGRPPHKAIPVLLGMQEQLADIVRFPLDPCCNVLMEKFWPGPLTLVLQANNHLLDILTAGQQTIAVRIPQHDLLRQLLCDIGPLAVTSANLSGRPETHSAEQVKKQLDGRIPLILSDEKLERTLPHKIGIASTILDLSGSSVLDSGPHRSDARYKFLRAGPIHVAVQHLLDNIKAEESRDSQC